VAAVALIVILAYAFWPKGNPPHDSTSEATKKAEDQTNPAPSTTGRSSAKVSNSTKITKPSLPSQPVSTKAAVHSSGGAVLQQVLPQVADSARRTITGRIKVRVEVSVDQSGNVTEAKLDKSGPSKYFARLSQQAAEKWKFEPAQANGQPAPSEWFLDFVFTSSGTNATSQQLKH
jgi:TonB family protein